MRDEHENINSETRSQGNIDPTILSGISLVFEKAINKALQYDPGTRSALSKLSPFIISLESTSPSMQLSVHIDEGAEISVSLLQENRQNQDHSHKPTADIQMSGAFSDFVSLALSQDHMLAKHNISVSGKIHHLSQLQEIANNIDIDWEEPITELLGVIPGHFVSNKIRSATRWAKYQKDEIKHWFPEVIQGELRLVPARSEVEHFFNDIDTLKALTQRLEARIHRLQQQTEQKHSKL